MLHIFHIPETYIEGAYVKAGLILLSIIITALFILPIITPAIIFLAVAMYFKDIKNAGKAMKRELEITVADMKAGNYEGALTWFETSLGSSALSEVV